LFLEAPGEAVAAALGRDVALQVADAQGGDDSDGGVHLIRVRHVCGLSRGVCQPEGVMY
jgi:hypothetical protein